MAVEVDDRVTPEIAAEQRRLDESGRKIARSLDLALNGDAVLTGAERKYGFALLLFAFGDPPQPATYLSNGTREDMIRTIEEWLGRVKARI